jgi:hypothetical protein
MTKQQNPSKRGRPPTGVPVLIRIPAETLETIDAVASARHVSRAELIRQVLLAAERAGEL